MSPILIIAAFAGEELDVVVRTYEPVGTAINLVSWWLEADISYEAPGILVDPDTHTRRHPWRLITSIRWSTTSQRSNRQEQFNRFLVGLNKSKSYFKRRGAEMTVRPIKTTSEPACTIETCTAFEVVPIDGPSFLDVPLGLPEGSYEWGKVAQSYSSQTHHGLRLMANSFQFAGGVDVPKDATLRTFLHEVCDKRCTWTFAARKAPGKNGGFQDLLAIRPRGSAWISGKRAAKESHAEGGSRLPQAFDPIPIAKPPRP